MLGLDGAVVHVLIYIFCVSGIQQAAAVGRGVMEMILDGGFQTIDLRRLSFDRIMTDMPILEQNVW